MPFKQENSEFDENSKPQTNESSEKDGENPGTACLPVMNNSYIRAIRNSNLLKLIVIEAKHLEVNSEIILSQTHINGRHSQKELTFLFGKDADNNDFNFPDEENVGKSQFEINYQADIQNYSLKDLNIGTGTFVKLINQQIIDKDYIFSFCEIHLFVYKPLKDNKLKFKFLLGEHKNKVFTFSPRYHKTVTIGRSRNATVSFKNDSISRVQCSFTFDTFSNDWVFEDGQNEIPSTNGTWLLATNMISIYDGLIFKSGNSTFQAKLE